MTLTLEWACGFEQFGAVSDIAQVAQPWTAQLSNGNFLSISTTTGVRSLQGSGVTPKALNLGSYVNSGVIWTVPNIGTRYLGMGWFLPGSGTSRAGIMFAQGGHFCIVYASRDVPG